MWANRKPDYIPVVGKTNIPQMKVLCSVWMRKSTPVRLRECCRVGRAKSLGSLGRKTVNNNLHHSQFVGEAKGPGKPV